MISFKEIKEGLFSYEETEGGWVATVKKPADLLKAAEKARDAGVKRFDCFSPMPLHGMDKAMGMKRSWIPFITLVTGLAGAALQLLYITYVDLFSWPIVYGGKPHFAIFAYIPILFEITVFFGGLSTVAAVIILGRLGYMNRKPVAPGITSDTFAIWIGDNLSKEQVENLLSGLGAEIKPVE